MSSCFRKKRGIWLAQRSYRMEFDLENRLLMIGII